MAKNEIVSGTIPFKKGTYAGELKNGLPNGRGVYYFEHQSPEGDKRQGLMCEDYVIAASEVRGGRQEVQFESPQGTSYDGGWKNGLKHGRGILRFRDGSQKIGLWVEDRFQQEVFEVESEPEAVSYLNGLYSGDIEDGVPHGWGCFTCDDFSYDGEWKFGARHGEGTYSTPTEVYRGGWVDNKRHGYGVEESSQSELSRRYEGSWENDLEHGHGTLRIGDMAVYEGGWKDGKKHGHGIEISTLYGIQSKYIGEWKNSRKDGLGKETTIMRGMKSEYKGGWRNNQKCGFGQEYIDGGGVKLRSTKVSLNKLRTQ